MGFKGCRLVLFDMDGTLLKDRSIFVFADVLGFRSTLRQIFDSTIEPYKKSIKIAKLLKGVDCRDLLEIFQQIPLQDNVEKIVKKLKEKHITTAIATDSYQFLADDLQARLDIDFAFANHLITHQHQITGEIHLNNSKHKVCLDGRIYSICKDLILQDLCKKLDIKVDETIAIGDGIVDIGMIQRAGLGIAFQAPEKVQKSADVVTNDLNILLKYM